MARGTSLNALIQMLRRELKIAENPALAQNVRAAHAYALSSAQFRLYEEFDWPFKIVTRDIALSAGERYYAMPADMDFENLRAADVLYSSHWFPVLRGIDDQNFNVINSDTDQRLDPVRRWRFYNDPDDNGDMLEFWPIPASNGGTVRFRGVKKLGPLIADADVAELDDYLLVYHAALDFIANPRMMAAAQDKATRHYMALRRNTSNTGTFVSGGGVDPHNHVRPPRIIITPAQNT